MIATGPIRRTLSRPTTSPTVARFVLITPARNEADLIGGTLRAVVAQSLRPVRWIIVSDGSTDGTDDIVRRFAREHAWIKLLRMPEHRDRQFGAKALCFNAGYARAKDVTHEFVGNLDADITFDADYFAFLFAQFVAHPQLGVAGTPFVEDLAHSGQHSYAHGHANLEHVSGACQIFRRECFEAIGGYVPIKGGAIDWIAVTTARMYGWQTRTFTEKVCFHHRPIGTGNQRALFVPFHYGRKAYYVGGHPLWAILRGFFQMRNRPRMIGGVLFQLGFFWAMLTRVPRVVSPELMAFHRGEQSSRLRALLRFRRRNRPKGIVPATAVAATPAPQAAASAKVPHITLCICTFRRPALLRGLLRDIGQQEICGQFTLSVVICDNDNEPSARPVVEESAARSPHPITYCHEPCQNIALARNRALRHSRGEFVAFMDDDEFPAPDWLRQMLAACERHAATGVLGPVRPHFETTPPRWIVAGGFCDRPEHPTGTIMHWSKSRTGNLLFRRAILADLAEPFDPQFGTGGEDVDFFRRMSLSGACFKWCNEGVVYEVVPPSRLSRSYMLKRALLRGRNNLKLGPAPGAALAKSTVAASLYMIVLPATLPFGHHVFMNYSIKLCDHLGRVLASIGLNPVSQRSL